MKIEWFKLALLDLGQVREFIWQENPLAAERVDFTTPPKRPDSKGLADRILKVLDAAEDSSPAAKPVH